MGRDRAFRHQVLLLAGDLLAFVIALALAAAIRFELNPGWFSSDRAPWRELALVLPYALALFAAMMKVSGLYRPRLQPLHEVVRVLRAVGLTFLVLGAATFFYRGFSYSRAMVLIMVPLLPATVLLARLGVRFLWHQVLRLEPVQGTALVVGTGPMARRVARALGSRRSEYHVRGLVSAAPDAASPGGGLPVLADVHGIEDLLAAGRDRAVFVADAALPREAQMRIAEACLKYGARYHVVPDVYELMLDRMDVDVVGGVPLLTLRGSNLQGAARVVKRLFDLAAASGLLLAAGPVMLATALGIKLSSKGPVFFTQERVGLNGRTFRFIKFRSMHVHTDDGVHREYVRKWMQNEAAAEIDGQKTYKLTRDPRIFAFGAFIRRYSIDELPQLFNVLRGDMSLVGPRPPIPYEVADYREWHRRRFEALPGITGLWQVSGRNQLSFDDMVKLDIQYIDNWSIELDLRIALRTAWVVLRGSAY